MMVPEPARCDDITRNENIIAVGNSGTSKTHIALGPASVACRKGITLGFITASAPVRELPARDEKRLLRLQKQLTEYRLPIINEPDMCPCRRPAPKLFFEVFSRRHERGSTIVTSNLPFDEWTGVFGSERLTGAPLDRLTHHVHIPEMNGESFRLKQGRCDTTKRQDRTPASQPRLQSLFRLVVEFWSSVDNIVEWQRGGELDLLHREAG